jgi:hypothetical protein
MSNTTSPIRNQSDIENDTERRNSKPTKYVPWEPYKGAVGKTNQTQQGWYELDAINSV